MKKDAFEDLLFSSGFSSTQQNNKTNKKMSELKKEIQQANMDPEKIKVSNLLLKITLKCCCTIFLFEIFFFDVLQFLSKITHKTRNRLNVFSTMF